MLVHFLAVLPLCCALMSCRDCRWLLTLCLLRAWQPRCSSASCYGSWSWHRGSPHPGRRSRWVAHALLFLAVVFKGGAVLASLLGSHNRTAVPIMEGLHGRSMQNCWCVLVFSV